MPERFREAFSMVTTRWVLFLRQEDVSVQSE
jgi:hypothetical protein